MIQLTSESVTEDMSLRHPRSGDGTYDAPHYPGDGDARMLAQGYLGHTMAFALIMAADYILKNKRTADSMCQPGKLVCGERRLLWSRFKLKLVTENQEVSTSKY